MNQFFKVGKKVMNVFQMRKWREEADRRAAIFCPFCIAKAVRHSNNCPTRKEGFDPETAIVLSKEERELLIEQKNGSNSDKSTGKEAN